MLRYGTARWMCALFGQGFPIGTLTVNLIGALCIGFLSVIAQNRVSGCVVPMRAFVFIGLLGGFTTFSTFSLETVTLLEAGEYLSATSNIILNVALCLLGVWLGMLLGRQI